jgi:hypothetical protein
LVVPGLVVTGLVVTGLVVPGLVFPGSVGVVYRIFVSAQISAKQHPVLHLRYRFHFVPRVLRPLRTSTLNECERLDTLQL